MKAIFKFSTEEQLNAFDKKYNFSGCFSGEKSVWIYGEGTDKWFSIQYCGDRWCLNTIKRGNNNSDFSLYPSSYKEFVEFIENKMNN